MLKLFCSLLLNGSQNFHCVPFLKIFLSYSILGFRKRKQHRCEGIKPWGTILCCQFSLILHFTFVPSQERSSVFQQELFWTLSQVNILWLCTEHSACRICLCMAMHWERAKLTSAELHANTARQLFLLEPACSEWTLSWTRLYQTCNFKLCTCSDLHRLFSALQDLKNQSLFTLRSIFSELLLHKWRVCVLSTCTLLNLCFGGWQGCMHSKQRDKWQSKAICGQCSCEWEPACLKAARDDIFKVRLDVTFSNLV